MEWKPESEGLQGTPVLCFARLCVPTCLCAAVLPAALVHWVSQSPDQHGYVRQALPDG
jgi:hypothetical protein